MNRSAPQLRSRRRPSSLSNNAVLNPRNRKSLLRLKRNAFLQRRRLVYYGKRILAIFALSVAMLHHALRFYHLMDRNLGGFDLRQEIEDYGVDPSTSCPELPDRLYHVHRTPSVPMTRKEVDEQVGSMTPVNQTTGGNIILQCPHTEKEITVKDDDDETLLDPHPNDDPSCRGIVKIFRSKSIYYHAKRCLYLLEESGITPRLLYTDDEALTLVEEQIAPFSLWEAPIPKDIEVQLLNIRCILFQYSIIHRDNTPHNFVVEPLSGKVYIIDFSDAFVGGAQWWSSWRNLVNFFNVWWKWHDEDYQRYELVENTKRLLRRDRIWQPPISHEKWEPSDEDLRILGGRPRFDLLKDIH